MNLFTIGETAMMRLGRSMLQVEVLECNARNFKVRNPISGKEFFAAKLYKHQNFTREITMEENTTYEEEFPNPAPEDAQGRNLALENAQGRNLALEDAQGNTPALENAQGNTTTRTAKKKTLLEFAIECLKEYNEPMSCKEIILMAETAGWERTGKTPEQSLYSGIFREIQTKGVNSRFRKSQVKGKFELAR